MLVGSQGGGVMRESLHGRRRSIAIDELVRQSASRKITRRQFCERALGLGLSASAAGALLAACGAAAKKTPVFTPSPMSTTLPKKLYLLNWADYMDRATKVNFTKKYGVEVVESYWDNGETYGQTLNDSRHYQLMIVPDYWLHIFAAGGYLTSA
jgi:spermidine/putrescine-binding protein